MKFRIFVISLLMMISTGVIHAQSCYDTEERAQCKDKCEDGYQQCIKLPKGSCDVGRSKCISDCPPQVCSPGTKEKGQGK
jgi:hypothetical protein